MATLVIVAFLVIGSTTVLRRGSRGLLNLLLIPVVAFVAAHALQAALGYDHPIGVQLANRGVAYYLILALLPVGHLVELGLGALRRHGEAILRGGRVLAFGGIILLTATSLSTQSASARQFAEPVPSAAMHEAADFLRAEVAPLARFMVQGDPSHGELNLAFAARWLASESGRNVLNPFVPEIAPGAALTTIAYTPRFPTKVDGWIDRARRLAVTHVVASQPGSVLALRSSDHVQEAWRGGQLVIFELVGGPGRPVGSLLDVPSSTAQRGASGTKISIRYEHPSTLTTNLALGWSPKWRASIDGSPVTVRRSADDRLEIDLPPGAHTVTLVFVSGGGIHLTGEVLVKAFWVQGPGLRHGRSSRSRSRERGLPRVPGGGRGVVAGRRVEIRSW